MAESRIHHLHKTLDSAYCVNTALACTDTYLSKYSCRIPSNNSRRCSGVNGLCIKA